MYMWVAAIAWFLMILGYTCRDRPHTHIVLMATAMALDVLLVIYLQIFRGAIQTAVGLSLTLPEMTHIAFSTVALLLYPLVVWHGIALYRGAEHLRTRHLRLGLGALISRSIGFLFMFSMWRH